MPNIVAVVQDDRTRRQIEMYLQELGMDDLRFATFKSAKEFEDLYFVDRSSSHASESEADPAAPPADGAPAAAAPPPEPEKAEDGAELRLFSEVHLLLFAIDSIPEKPSPWITRVRAELKKFKIWPADNQMRWILMKYEDDGVAKLDLLHPALNDLIYLPLDRLVFLQKLQIFLELPKKATPRFLFNQEVKLDIEISKITKLDRLSDVGIAIRNPVPLVRGLPGHFYINLPGEKNRLELKAKVFRSMPHPEIPGQYLVYFSFFGIDKNQLSQIRRTLSKSPRYQSLLSTDREAFRFKPDPIFMPESDKHVFGVAVVDSDDQSAANLAQQLRKDMDKLQVVTENSYLLFLHHYFESTGAAADRSPPKATETTDFYAPYLSLSITPDLKCTAFDPAPGEKDVFLGHAAPALIAAPDQWLSLFQDKESRLITEEAVQLALKGNSLRKLLILHAAGGERHAVNAKFSKAGDVVTLELTPATLSDIMNKMTSEVANKLLEVLLIDSAFVPEDPATWIEGLRTRAVQVGLVDDPKKLKFFLLGDANSKTSELYLENPDVLGLFLKPIDFRQLTFMLSELLPNPHTPYQFENIGWSEPGYAAHISKPVQLEALSEFGATFKTKQVLVPGTIIYLRKSIYENAPNGCLAARVYACDEHPNDKGFYQIHTTYFGINDGFLKFARTWIRENYAIQKSQSDG